MAKEKLSKREARRQKMNRRRQRQRLTPILLMALGALLIGGAYFLVSSRDQPVKAASNFTTEDIVYGEPLHAIHEMTGASTGTIAFLPKNGPQPKIAVSEDFYSFGSIGATEIVTYDFVIQNVGEAPLTINRAYTTCGCTTADFTATEIPPGKVVVMTLTLDAGYHDVRGQTVRRGVIIESNDPDNPEIELWTQASVLDS
ncbi:MAG: DUF1573 domain-containing protein [Chloroflexi bacterium]|nr:MAG: DUF1573 domain-containing protein [Chloroflexota bacterium]